MGLVNKVVPDNQLDAEVEAWCREIMERSPTAIAIAKRSFDADSDSIAGIGALGMQALSFITRPRNQRRGCAPSTPSASRTSVNMPNERQRSAAGRLFPRHTWEAAMCDLTIAAESAQFGQVARGSARSIQLSAPPIWPASSARRKRAKSGTCAAAIPRTRRRRWVWSTRWCPATSSMPRSRRGAARSWNAVPQPSPSPSVN